MRCLLLVLTTVLASPAEAQRKALERAAAYERGGMLEEAFDRYAQVRQRKPKNVEAHLGMRRTAQGIFDRMQQEASGLYLANDYAAGERKRTEAAQFKARMDRHALGLDWDPLFEARRREAQLAEAERLYTVAEEAFRADRFEEAGSLAEQCLKLDASHKKAEYLGKLAQLEPLYRQGMRAAELGLWRDAHMAFKRITDRDATYKDAWQRQAAAREKAQVVLAYVPLLNPMLYMVPVGLTLPGALEAHLAAGVKTALLDLNDPLLVLVDRENTEQLLAEQQRQLAGVYDDRHVVEAGRLMGARYVLTGKIVRYDDVLRREMDVQVQLLDVETGRIHLSELVHVNKHEIGRGNARSQLMERAAKRIAAHVARFDPHKR